MLGSRHEPGQTLTSRLRDIVEIVAIVAAGCWAFYVFIYENRIKPLSEQASITVTGTLDRAGERDGLLAIRERVTIHNEGHVTVTTLGEAFTLKGSRITALTRPADERSATSDLFRRDATRASAVVLERSAYVTHAGDARTNAGLIIEPGSSSSTDHLVYVAKNKYDRLDLYFLLVFTRLDEALPTKLVVEEDGSPDFEVTDPRGQTERYNFPAASLSLWDK